MSSDSRLGSLAAPQSGRAGSYTIRVNTSPTALLTPTEAESPNNSIQHEYQVMQDEENLAVRRLLESWMDRLQLISVLAIFFASLEATLLSITMPQDQGKPDLSAASQAANVGLTGGLLLHILAAFVSFLGGFFLIRYRIQWAKVEQKTLLRNRRMQSFGSSNGSDENLYQSPTTADRGESGIPFNMHMPSPQATRQDKQDSTSFRFTRPPLVGGCEGPRRRRGKTIWVLTEYPALFPSYNTPTSCPRSGLRSTLHHLPTKLLSRFHSLCVILTLLGFVFSLIGIVLNAWERLPHVVGIVCTIFISTTLLTVLGMMCIPDREAEEYPDT